MSFDFYFRLEYVKETQYWENLHSVIVIDRLYNNDKYKIVSDQTRDFFYSD